MAPTSTGQQNKHCASYSKNWIKKRYCAIYKQVIIAQDKNDEGAVEKNALYAFIERLVAYDPS